MSGNKILKPHVQCNDAEVTVASGPVDYAIGLELAAELGQECQALLLACQFQQVGPLVGNGCSPCGHLKNLLLLGFPCDDIEFLLLQNQNSTQGQALICRTGLPWTNRRASSRRCCRDFLGCDSCEIVQFTVMNDILLLKL